MSLSVPICPLSLDERFIADRTEPCSNSIKPNELDITTTVGAAGISHALLGVYTALSTGRDMTITSIAVAPRQTYTFCDCNVGSLVSAAGLLGVLKFCGLHKRPMGLAERLIWVQNMYCKFHEVDIREHMYYLPW
jgi:hypothetical protein